MAEIKVDHRGGEPPRRGFKWWYLLPLLLIPLFFVRGCDDNEQEAAPVVTDTAVVAPQP